MQAEGLLCPACIDRGLKRHEKTGSVLNVSAQNSPKIIHIGNCETRYDSDVVNIKFKKRG